MQINASIDEADIGKIKEGQEVIFTVDAYSEQSFKGNVNQIRLSPEVVQNVVSYDVIIGVSNPNLLLKPGMTANVTILVDSREDIIKVPSGALRFSPPMKGKESLAGGAEAGNKARSSSPPNTGSFNPQPPGSKRANQTTLWILNQQGKPEPVSVKIGISDGTFTQVIADNLKEGDKVITGQKGSGNSSSNQQVNPFAPQFGGGRR
jgi:HlyD family secretion protein